MSNYVMVSSPKGGACFSTGQYATGLLTFTPRHPSPLCVSSPSCLCVCVCNETATATYNFVFHVAGFCDQEWIERESAGSMLMMKLHSCADFREGTSSLRPLSVQEQQLLRLAGVAFRICFERSCGGGVV